MLIDFETVHRTYFVGWSQDGSWRYTPTNDREPRKGFYASSHQVFSNHALQIALSIYNTVDAVGNCVGINHCLFLLFSRKEQGKYLLVSDQARIGFHLDLGVAGDLYGLAVGHYDSTSYRAVRSGKSPKAITGTATFRDGRRVIALSASTYLNGHLNAIEVELDRAAAIALAAHCLAYGRLLYPSLGDAAVQSLLSNPSPYFRACAEKSPTDQMSRETPATAETGGSSRESALHSTANSGLAPTFSPQIVRLHKAIWAIGNKKWPSMMVPALQSIQKLDDAVHLQRLIDSGNRGDFREWDAYLS